MCISSLRRLFVSNQHDFQRAPEQVFERSRIGLAPTPDAAGGPGLRMRSTPEITELSAQQRRYSTADFSALNLDLGPTSLVSITGDDSCDTYSLDLHTEVRCNDPRQAHALLEWVSLSHEGGKIVLRNRPNLPGIHCRSFLDIVLPPTGLWS